MIHGGPYNRQTDGDVHSRLDSKHLHRTVALIMIHRYDNVEVAPGRSKKKRIRRQRTLHIPATGLAGANGRLDFYLFFAMSEKTVLTRMRIDATNADARMLDSFTGQGVMSADNRSL